MSHATRRTVLRGGLATLASLVVPTGWVGCGPRGSDPTEPVDTDGDSALDTEVEPFVHPPLRSRIEEVGPLGAANADGVRVPEGFSARIIARSGEPVLPDGHFWHLWPDGGACFATRDGGWIYVSNSELPIVGGAGAVRFDAEGQIIDAYPILQATNINCAGGPTPWGTWLSCEEIAKGRVFECDPWGAWEAVDRPGLGRFKHEAATVDPVHGCVYLSEDESDGRFYRYVAASADDEGRLDLDSGTLEVAVVDEGGLVSWVTVPDPLAAGELPTRLQVAEATVFNGGEGLWWHEGVVYLSTKGDNRVWAYDTETQLITTIYDRATAADSEALFGVDNLTVTACGDVLVAEDAGMMRIVAVLPDGQLKTLVQIEGQEGSEITGPAFDPTGTRLYFSSQRAEGATKGITYEVTGPFHEPLTDERACPQSA